MMCQVLRVYRHAFGVRCFEVDAHQFGLDNPDGIASGAFWFYYRHGFRPVDAALARRADAERARLDARPGARSTEQTLLAFTGSNVELNFGGPRPPHLFDLTTAVTRLVRTRFGGSRVAAEREAVQGFLAATKRRPPRDAAAGRVLGEVALLALALDVTDPGELALLARMVDAKPRDVFAYQRLLLQWLPRCAALGEVRRP
jgi:hypothetical protein